MSEGQRGVVWQRLCAVIGPTPGDPTDGQLLERYAVHREPAAFAALVRRHGPMVFGLCRRVLGDPHAAEDAFQATFLVLVRKATALDRRRPLGNWLYTVAYHAALKARASSAHRVQREAQAARPEAVEPADGAESAELRCLVDAELSRLPDKYRQPLVLCYLQGQSHEEAAAQLGWPSGTVKGRLARARDLLRDRLARRGLAFTATALTATIVAPVSAASVSVGLVERTVEAAIAGSLTTPAAIIAKGVLQAMWTTKLKTAVLVASAVLLTASLGALIVHAHMALSAAPVPPTDAPAGLPEAKGKRLAVDPVRSTDVMDVVNDVEDRPLITLGLLGDDSRQTRPLELSTAFLENRLALAGPKAGHLTSMMVLWPDLNSGEDASLDMLTRDGNSFTLVMNVWQDDTARLRNLIHRKLFINVPLGKLEPGKYELRIVCRRMLKETAKALPWYEYKSAKTATVAFNVSKDDDNDSGKPVLLKYDALREPQEKPKGIGSFYQFPKPQFYGLDPAGAKEIAQAQGLRVGTFDLDKWAASKPAKVTDLPKLGEPAAGDPVYATVLSPVLNSGEWMSLRAIEWKDKEVILHMGLWQDRGPRARNILSEHYLIIPLQTPPVDAKVKSKEDRWPTVVGEYRVKVAWTFLLAENYPTPGELYAPRDATEFGEQDSAKQLLDHSEAKFILLK
jgi:RNA polymerase sigma factor (sigma-70 family)